MKPEQIDYRAWHERFKDVPEELIETTRYFRHLPDAEWSQYLFPPSTHSVYGNRLLRKLKFDNSQAALRLWGFVMSEGERIYRAKQAGMKVIAVLGDLGAVTPLIYSFPNTVAFYPDCLWWTPFLMESKVLFDEAAEYGLGEDSCFVRAALGAFSKKAYFPQPDLCIGTVGATCDDMAAVMSEAEFIGYDIHYFELPHRDDLRENHDSLKQFLTSQYLQVCTELDRVTGTKFDPDSFIETIQRVNRLRSTIAEIKMLTADSASSPMGGLELLNVEFAVLSYYGDLNECIAVLEEMRDAIRERVSCEAGYDGQDIRLVWVTPPADPILMNYIEGLGGRIVGSEYLINQTTPLFVEPISNPSSPCHPRDLDSRLCGNDDGFTRCQPATADTPIASHSCQVRRPDSGELMFDTLAEAHLSGTLMGSTRHRVNLVLDQVRRYSAEGVIISGVFGSSHCPYETVPIVEALRKIGIPTLSFDVIAPGKRRVQSQLFNRMEAFMESLHARRNSRAG